MNKDNNKPANLKTTIIKSVAAVLCTALVAYSGSASIGKLADAKKAIAESSNPAAAVSGDTASGTDTESSYDSASDYVSTDETAPADSSETADSTETPAAETSAGSTSSASESSGTASSGNAGQTAKPAENKSGVPQTNAEIISYCNKALNDAKQAKVGYTKTFVRTCDPSLPGIVTSIINQNKVTTVAKGSDKIVDDFPAGGNTWSCKLREQDVSKVEFKQNGQYYEITLRLGTEHNPGKGETSKYGRAMTVVDAADAKEMLSAVKSVDFTYHDGYVYAKIDSKTGKLVKAEFSATADLVGDIAIIGSLSTKNLKSTETFTDIKW